MRIPGAVGVDDRRGQAGGTVLPIAVIAAHRAPLGASAAHDQPARPVESLERAPRIGNMRRRQEKHIGCLDEVPPVRIVDVDHVLEVHGHDGP